MSDVEKIEKVRRHAENMERRAKREEQLLNNGPGGAKGDTVGNVERGIAVNDRYIDAIHAKLKLLD